MHSIRIFLSCLISLLISGLVTGCTGLAGQDSVTATAQYGQINSLATQMSQQVQSTLQFENKQATAAVQTWIEIYKKADTWPAVLFESFNDNVNEWPTGDEDGQYTTISWKIDGKYHWEATAKEGFIYWTQPNISEVGDFYLSVDGQQISGPKDGDYGVIFRKTDNDNYTVFRINAIGQYGLDEKSGGSWYTHIDLTSSDAIHPERVNHIAVIGVGKQISFFINNQYITSISDQPELKGSAGLAIEMYNKGDKGVFEFDNFIYRSPEQASTPAP